MTGILSFDIATSTGWSFYDTEKHHSAIVCDVFDVRSDAETGVLKRHHARRMMDEKVCRLIDQFRPDIACLEQPLNWIKPQGGGGKRRKKAPLIGDIEPPQEPTEGKGGPNADAVLMLNQIFAVVDNVCFHKVPLVIDVAPKTWQTITARCAGKTTKDRSIELCRLLRIQIPPSLTRKEDRGDAADAAAIGYWCAGHSQAAKLYEKARAAA